MNVKAIIFDWGRTLFDSDAKKEFPEAEQVLLGCKEKNLRLALVSLVSNNSNANLEERTAQIEDSHLRQFFETALVIEGDKDKILEQTVAGLGLPREEILIVDDRTIRGIKYGSKHGHPTVWLQKGRFAQELPDEDTGTPTYTINSLSELLNII